jgi:hypothetical protein
MKIDKIFYQRIFPLAPYVNERVGVEVQIEEGDDPEAVLAEAKSFVLKFSPEPEKRMTSVIDSEYEMLKVKLIELVNNDMQLSAKALLASTPYRLNIELKKIVEDGKE